MMMKLQQRKEKVKHKAGPAGAVKVSVTWKSWISLKEGLLLPRLPRPPREAYKRVCSYILLK